MTALMEKKSRRWRVAVAGVLMTMGFATSCVEPPGCSSTLAFDGRVHCAQDANEFNGRQWTNVNARVWEDSHPALPRLQLQAATGSSASALYEDLWMIYTDLPDALELGRHDLGDDIEFYWTDMWEHRDLGAVDGKFSREGWYEITRIEYGGILFGGARAVTELTMTFEVVFDGVPYAGSVRIH